MVSAVQQNRLLLITGMSGSGKTTLAGFLKESNYRVITMGDVIRDLARERGLEPTPENLGKLAKEIRDEGGEAAVARACIPKIKSENLRPAAVDGIRSLREVEAFREALDTFLVAVHASPRTRFERLRRRGRSDDPEDFEGFSKRDLRELGFSMGDAIAMAEYMIVNEGGFDDFRRSYVEMVERLRGP